MAAKKKKKPAVAEPRAPRQEVHPIVFPASMTGLKPKTPIVALELKKTRAAETEPESAKSRALLMMLLQPRNAKPRREIRLLPQSPLMSSQSQWLFLHLNIVSASC